MRSRPNSASPLTRLRSLAAGLHPGCSPSTGSSGRCKCWQCVADTVQLVTSEQRLRTEVEAAVYHLCSEALAEHCQARCCVPASASRERR